MSDRGDRGNPADGEAGQGADLAALQERIGYRFRDASLLEQALRHGSAATEARLRSNETLEFLGDAVVDLVVSEMLLQAHPLAGEGELTRRRAAIVNAKGLAAQALRLDLGRWLRLGRGEARSGGERKGGVLADAFEALVGAVFLDGGYQAARVLLQAQLAPAIAAADPLAGDWKTELQERTQAASHRTPTYTLLEASGPDHARRFRVAVEVGGRLVAEGEGSSRKAAEQEAARGALERLAAADRPGNPAGTTGGEGIDE